MGDEMKTERNGDRILLFDVDGCYLLPLFRTHTPLPTTKDETVTKSKLSGTLTPARLKIKPEVHEFMKEVAPFFAIGFPRIFKIRILCQVRKTCFVGIVGGSDFKKQLEQLGDDGEICRLVCICAMVFIALLISSQYSITGTTFLARTGWMHTKTEKNLQGRYNVNFSNLSTRQIFL